MDKQQTINSTPPAAPKKVAGHRLGKMELTANFRRIFAKGLFNS